MRSLRDSSPAPSPVFGDLNQQALDEQYNNQANVPDFKRVLAHAAHLSTQARPWLLAADVRWGHLPSECLDIYGPAAKRSSAPLPVVVYVHGGGWLMLEKEDSAFAAPAWCQAGCLFVALGFADVGKLPFSQVVSRIQVGVAWVLEHIGTYGGDPAQVVLIGHSSGAHLASQCLGHLPLTHQGQLRGAVLISGLGDLEPVRLSYRNQRLQLCDDDVRRFSLLHQPLPSGCQVDVVSAEHDTAEFRRQASATAEHLSRHARLRAYHSLQGKNHFDGVLDLGVADSALFQQTRSFFSPHP